MFDAAVYIFMQPYVRRLLMLKIRRRKERKERKRGSCETENTILGSIKRTPLVETKSVPFQMVSAL